MEWASIPAPYRIALGNICVEKNISCGHVSYTCKNNTTIREIPIAWLQSLIDRLSSELLCLNWAYFVAADNKINFKGSVRIEYGFFATNNH